MRILIKFQNKINNNYLKYEINFENPNKYLLKTKINN